MMIGLTATDAHKTLFELIRTATEKHEIYRVRHRSGNVVIMSEVIYHIGFTKHTKTNLWCLSFPSGSPLSKNANSPNFQFPSPLSSINAPGATR